MAARIPYQENEAGLVCLLPDGRVVFLHPSAKQRIDDYEGKDSVSSLNLDDYILDSPWVDLDHFHLSAPAIVFIETTNLCNLRCQHCYAWSGPKREGELSTAQIMGLLDDLEAMGVLQVFLTGGELFSHPDAVEIICHARSKSFSTQIFTNGLLITEDMMSRIPPGQSFFVSFDTAVPERSIRGKMDFPKLHRCFTLMQDHGHVFRTAISVHAQNLDDVEEIFEWCIEHEFPRPQWLETHPIGRALLHPGILLQPSQVDRVIDIYKRCMDRFHLTHQASPVSGSRDSLDESPRPTKDGMFSVQTIKFCQALERATGQEKCGRTVAYIRSDGEVFPCSNCMSNAIYGAGNIKDGPFKKIWETGFQAFRSITFADHTICRQCPVHLEDVWCQFRCPPLAANVSGSESGCGATEYLRRFMLESHRYWEEKRKSGQKLVLRPVSSNRQP